MLNKNLKTNFTDGVCFEKTIPNAVHSGPMPHKGVADSVD